MEESVSRNRRWPIVSSIRGKSRRMAKRRVLDLGHPQ